MNQIAAALDCVHPAEILGFVQVAWLPSLYELVGTLLVTTLIWFALPEKYRKPLWGPGS